MEVLLEVSGFNVNGDVVMTMIQVHINVHKCDLGRRGMPREYDMVVVFEVFKELDVGIGINQRLAFLRAEGRKSCSRKLINRLV